MILTTLVVLSEKLPLLSDSESGESMSLNKLIFTKQDLIKWQQMNMLIVDNKG